MFIRIKKPAIAFVLLRVWDFWVITHMSALDSDYWFVNPFGAGIPLLLALAILYSQKSCGNNGRFRKVDYFVACIGLLVTIHLFDAWNMRTEVLLGMLVVAGLCLAWLSFKSLLSLISLSKKDAIISVLIGSMVALALQGILAALPALIAAVIVAIFPIGATVFIGETEDVMLRVNPQNTVFGKKNFLASLMRIATCLGGVVLSYSIINSFLKNEYGSYVFAPEALPVITIAGHIAGFLSLLFLTIWTFNLKRPINFLFFLRLPTLLVICAALLVLFVGDSPMLQIMTFASVTVLIPVIWIVAIDVAKQCARPPAVIAAWGLLVYSIPYYLGLALYKVMVTLLGTTTLGAPQLLIVLGILSGTLILSIRPYSQEARFVLTSIDGTVTAIDEYQSLDKRCEELGRLGGLTDRELEVAKLLAKGKSKISIAEELFITENTVRTYAKRIYLKLDIHSKQEFLKKLEL